MKYIKEYNHFIDQDLFDQIYDDIKELINDVNLEIKDEGKRAYLYVDSFFSLNRTIHFKEKYNEDIFYLKFTTRGLGDQRIVFNNIDRIVRFLSSKYSVDLSYGLFFNHEIAISKRETIDTIKFLYEFERKEDQDFYLYDDVIQDSNYKILADEILDNYDILFLSMDGDVGLSGFRIMLKPKKEVEKYSYIYNFKRSEDLVDMKDEVEYDVDVYKIPSHYNTSVIHGMSERLTKTTLTRLVGGEVVDNYKFKCDIYDKEYEHFYKLFIDNFVKNSGHEKSKLILKILNELSGNTFFEIDEFDYNSKEIILFIEDRVIKLSVDNNLNVYLDGSKINSDDVVEEIYLKLTDKNAV